MHLLREYQVKALEFMLNRPRCGVFLEMGLGKTLIALHYLSIIHYTPPALIIAPASVIRNKVWQDENEKWECLLDISVLDGPPERREKRISERHDIFLISPDNLVWLHKQKKKFTVVIVDEFSMFKNPSSLRFKNLRQLADKATNFIGLTGTPISHDIFTIWGLIRLIDGGERLYKYRSTFKDRWFIPDKRNAHVIFSWKARKGAAAEILDKIKDITITMKAEDYLQLPEFIDINYKVEIGGIPLALYRKLEAEFILSFKEGDVDAVNKAVLVNKLIQIAAGSVYTEKSKIVHIHDAKIETLKDLYNQRDSNILVYCSYKHVANKILKNIEGSEEFNQDRWNKKKIPLMVCNPQEVGYGLNLQEGGSIIVWYNPIYNMELYRQANARLYRQGQTVPVRNYILLAQGTIDTAVYDSLNNKTANLDAVFRTLKI